MLELDHADGAFEQLEAWLAAELREGESADVYLGYGLSEPLRRAPWASPPEPCPLPLLAARRTDRAGSGDTSGPHPRPCQITPSHVSEGYRSGCARPRQG